MPSFCKPQGYLLPSQGNPKAQLLATPTTPQGSYYILLQRAVVSTLSAKPALPAVSPLFNPAVPCHVPSRLSLSQPVGLPTPAYTCLHLPACLPAGLTPSPSPTSQAPMPVQHTVKACLKARSTSPFYTELTNDTWVQPSYASPLSYQNQACSTQAASSACSTATRAASSAKIQPDQA